MSSPVRIKAGLTILIFTLIVIFACSDKNPAEPDNSPPDNDTIPEDTVVLGPILTINEPEFAFGYTPQHSKISHTFYLYSAGDDTLEIVRVAPG
jgi:hypothetical protein